MRNFKKCGVKQRVNNYPTVIKPQSVEFGNLPDKELKITVLKKVNELQENTETQF